MHTAPYFTAFGLLALLHSTRVVIHRRKHRIGIGLGENAELEKLVRIFGNFTDYVPLGLVLLISLEFVQAPTWYLHLAGMTLLVGRLLHSMGLNRSVGKSPGRVVGMLLTMFSILVSSIGVTLFSLVTP